jgi:endoglucanase
VKLSSVTKLLFIAFASLLSPLLIAAATPTTKIKVDQVGYLPDAPKMAMVVSGTQADDFTVRRSNDNSVIFHGKLARFVDDSDTGERVQVADFTELKQSGTYYLEVPGVGRSWNFGIGAEVFTHVFYLAMRSYYGQRCGCAVDLGAEFPGYKHAACHLKGAYHPSSGKTGAQASTKGWHDAGDYGRYVVNSGLSTGTLLWTFELFGDRVKNVRLNLPESGNGTPDMLNEIRWNLDWMLSMQDKDGGVWHKQSSERFAAFVMPEQDDSVSYIIGTGSVPYKNSTATADFAAVMAIAARAFRAYDAAYATKALSAARQAWAWLEKNPDVAFRNPNGVLTGGYDDRNCADELLWASAELWRTTGEETYQSYFLAHFREHLNAIRPVGPTSWASVAPMAMWTYLLGGGKNSEALTTIRAASLKAADEIVGRTRSNGYRISLTTRDYEWGSNSVAANYSMQLLVANAIQPNPRFVQTAFENLHYLLGRNTFSLSWVTRVGSNPFRHPHHRPSAADTNAEPWPGLLSGGPNQHRQDSAMQRLPTLPPARMYLDEQESYASNEVAINWNAPLVFLLASALPK